MRGGDLVVHGRVGARSGIDQKGGTIIVLGHAASMTGFMMQRGRQILCGDVGPGLGDSMYDGTIYVGGTVKSLGIEVAVPGLVVDGSTAVRLRLRLTGTSPAQLRIKAWPADATEPAAWAVTATDAAPKLQQAGQLGLRAALGPASSGPVLVLRVDDLLVTGP